ncbi:MAG: hypothetical protein ACRCXX_04125 [Cetobacterium sp.]|uniref:hypothetical protein n=1 Tax=Cetobacterium sp. TaxID=2071632 RepID=UPI003F2C8DC3
MLKVKPDEINNRITYKVKYNDHSYDKVVPKIILLTVKGKIMDGVELYESIAKMLKDEFSYMGKYEYLCITDIEIFAVEDSTTDIKDREFDMKSTLKELAIFQMFMSGFKLGSSK